MVRTDHRQKKRALRAARALVVGVAEPVAAPDRQEEAQPGPAAQVALDPAAPVVAEAIAAPVAAPAEAPSVVTAQATTAATVPAPGTAPVAASAVERDSVLPWSVPFAGQSCLPT